MEIMEKVKRDGNLVRSRIGPYGVSHFPLGASSAGIAG